MTSDACDTPRRPRFRLPPDAYLSPEWFDAERTAIFDRSWTLVATSSELAGPTDRRAVVVGNHPMLVVRDDGGLRAFHNICRHRGMVLCDPATDEPTASTVRCPYHGWEWDLDGTLVRVPQRRSQFDGISTADLGLHPGSVDEWEGMVFVHPEPDAPPLRDHLGALPDLIGSYRPGLLDQVASLRIDVACNWKLFVENHIDVYHLWYLHEQSLGAYDHARFSHQQRDGVWASYEPLRARSAASDDDGRRGVTVIDHIDDRDRNGIGAHMVFPNLLIAATDQVFATYAIHPVSATESWIDLRVRSEADADGPELLEAVRSFIDEDVQACERVQAAMRSSRFSVGPLASDHERPIQDFHDRLVDRLGDLVPVGDA